jgi:hypothetical protein
MLSRTGPRPNHAKLRKRSEKPRASLTTSWHHFQLVHAPCRTREFPPHDDDDGPANGSRITIRSTDRGKAAPIFQNKYPAYLPIQTPPHPFITPHRRQYMTSCEELAGRNDEGMTCIVRFDDLIIHTRRQWLGSKSLRHQ